MSRPLARSREAIARAEDRARPASPIGPPPPPPCRSLPEVRVRLEVLRRRARGIAFAAFRGELRATTSRLERGRLRRARARALAAIGRLARVEARLAFAPGDGGST